MEIVEQKHGAVTVLKPKGPLMGDAAEALMRRLLEAADRSMGRVVVDAAGIPLTDSRGLEALADASDEMAGRGQALKLCACSDTLREVLELTDLAGGFEHYDDVNAAVRSFL
jgi:anti-sigma B factor antagonist